MRPKQLVAVHTPPRDEIEGRETTPVFDVYAQVGAGAELHHQVDVGVVFLSVSLSKT